MRLSGGLLLLLVHSALPSAPSRLLRPGAPASPPPATLPCPRRLPARAPLPWQRLRGGWAEPGAAADVARLRGGGSLEELLSDDFMKTLMKPWDSFTSRVIERTASFDVIPPQGLLSAPRAALSASQPRAPAATTQHGAGQDATQASAEEPPFAREVVPRSADLMEAASKGDVDEVRSLVAAGGKRLLLARDSNNHTALHLACFFGELAAVRALCELGGELSGRDLLMAQGLNDSSALHLASERGHYKVVKYLVGEGGIGLLMARRFQENTALHVAAERGHLDVVQHLAEAGGRELLFAKAVGGYTALHLSCVRGEIEVSRYLLEVGGNSLLMARDLKHSTALHFASWNGQVYVVRFLCEVGGRELLFARDLFGRTALHKAAEMGRLDVVKHLAGVVAGKEQRELLMAKDKQGFTALGIASRKDKQRVSEFLAKLVDAKLVLVRQSCPAGNRDDPLLSQALEQFKAPQGATTPTSSPWKESSVSTDLFRDD